MIHFKPGAHLNGGVTPEIWHAIYIAHNIWRQYGADLVVTSIRDGTHKNGSLHYEGRAVDLRSNNLNNAIDQDAAEKLRRALGDEYDVLFEYPDTPNEHVHLEHDPTHANR